MSFTILGTGSALPSLCKTNDDLSKIMDTSDEWIRARTGIEQRYLCGEESITDLACLAAEDALRDAGLAPADLDLILCATATGDYHLPSLACVVQERIGAQCAALDINAACSGFLYALDIAAGYYARKTVKHVLVIGAEALSKIVDWTDRRTAVIFADGAGAAVLGEGDDLLASRVGARGNCKVLYAENVKGNCPFRAQAPEDETTDDRQYIRMDGQEVFRFASASMVRDLKGMMKDAGLTGRDVSYVLPHQANRRIIDFASSKLPEIAPERFLTNIDKRGNTSAASIPVLLDEYNKKGTFQNGDILLFTAFGAGLTTASCALRWSGKRYNNK